MSEVEELITVIMVNFKTELVTMKCIGAVRRFYKTIPMLLIDNSNYDESSTAIYEFAKEDHNTTCLFNTTNLHHGPAMDLGLKIISSPYALILDSDTLLTQPNLIQHMLETVKSNNNDNNWIAVGNVAYVDKHGWNIRNKKKQESGRYIKYCNPKCMLINRKEYFKFPPFTKHGAPCIATMKGIKDANKEHMIIHFDWGRFGKHLCGATQHKYGLDGEGGKKIPPFI